MGKKFWHIRYNISDEETDESFYANGKTDKRDAYDKPFFKIKTDWSSVEGSPAHSAHGSITLVLFGTEQEVEDYTEWVRNYNFSYSVADKCVSWPVQLIVECLVGKRFVPTFYELYCCKKSSDTPPECWPYIEILEWQEGYCYPCKIRISWPKTTDIKLIPIGKPKAVTWKSGATLLSKQPNEKVQFVDESPDTKRIKVEEEAK